MPVIQQHYWFGQTLLRVKVVTFISIIGNPESKLKHLVPDDNVKTRFCQFNSTKNIHNTYHEQSWCFVLNFYTLTVNHILVTVIHSKMLKEIYTLLSYSSTTQGRKSWGFGGVAHPPPPPPPPPTYEGTVSALRALYQCYADEQDESNCYLQLPLVPMAFRSGQNYFKSIRNIQTSYKHVITLNIMLKISR
jgi:hypothetical protein